jgi:translation elongation factor P/translation initiation factor 5A
MTPEYRIIDDNVYVPEHYHVHNSATKGYVKGAVKYLSGKLNRKLRALSGNVADDLETLSGLLNKQHLALSGNIAVDINTAVTNLISGAPDALDTLKELADYVDGEGGLSGLVTTLSEQTVASIEALTENTAATIAALSEDVETQFKEINDDFQTHVEKAQKEFTAFSGAIDAQKVDKNVAGDNKILQNVTFSITKDGKLGLTKKLLSLQNGETEVKTNAFPLATDEELADAVLEINNKINEKIDIANFDEGSIVQDTRIESVTPQGSIIISTKVFNARKGTPPVTYTQEVTLSDDLTARLSGERIIIGNLTKNKLEDYITTNDLRVSRKVNATQFGEGSVIRDVRLVANQSGNEVSINKDTLNVITGHGNSYNRVQGIELEDGLVAKNNKGKLVLGNSISGALEDHIQVFNDTISNLIGTAPETLDQLHEIANYISGDAGLSGFITNNLGKINVISGQVKTLEEKVDDLEDTRVTYDDFGEGSVVRSIKVANIDNNAVEISSNVFNVVNKDPIGTDWPFAFKAEGLEITGEKTGDNYSKVIISNPHKAVVNKRPISDLTETRNKRVLMQSITFDQFKIDNQKVTGWLIDLDTGNEIPIEIDIKDLVTKIASINQAVVEKEAKTQKRVLMQSITFDKFTLGNQKVTEWMVNLDTGDQIPIEIDISDIVRIIAGIDKAVVNPRPSNDPVNPNKRVLLQSFTTEKLAQGKITAWSIDLDTGEELPNEIDLYTLVNPILMRQGVIAKVNKQPTDIGNNTANKRVLMQSVTFDKFTVSNPMITGWMVDLDTGAQIEVPIDLGPTLEKLKEIVPEYNGNRTYVQSVRFNENYEFKITRINLSASNPSEYQVTNTISLKNLVAKVNELPDPNNSSKKIRPLMQSVTFDKLEEGIITGWSIDLNTGNEIRYDIKLSDILAQLGGVEGLIDKVIALVRNNQSIKNKLKDLATAIMS